jgi:hypothetical protein
VPGDHLVVTPDQVDQELDPQTTQGVAYWEGDVSVRGQIAGMPVAGVGYTEIDPPSDADPPDGRSSHALSERRPKRLDRPSARGRRPRSGPCTRSTASRSSVA